MFDDEASIQRQLQREKNFSPPYCPRPTCRFHHKEAVATLFWKRHSSKPIKRFPYTAQRFQCRFCAKTFTASFFGLTYRQKVWGLNAFIFADHNEGISKRSTARRIQHTERMVRGRMKKISSWGLLKHTQLTRNLKIHEPIVYDGIENFSFSQFDPNNLNHAVGKNSLFIYDFNLCPLNRKGRMSPSQKLKKSSLEKQFGPYPTDAIRTSTKQIFDRLLARSVNKLIIFSDKHFQYQKVVQEDLKDKSIEHFTVSSKVHRNFQNPLFAVNNIDLQLRHNIASFKRETIAFSKHTIAMQETFVAHLLYRNYMRPKFWGTHRSDPESSKRSPAMEIGLVAKILSFKDFFKERVLATQVPLHQDALQFILRVDPLSRRPIQPARL